ncbi:MAG: leucine-rich repeat protein [Bacteroidales bacterium]|jgi:hypothetical protein|nr:leucine-rich repeat protein [Bacteroidales bacterium]
MKNRLFLTAVAIIGSFTVQSVVAQNSGTCGDNLIWTLTGSGTAKTLTISGTGAMTNFVLLTDIPWYNQRNDIQALVIDNGVGTIGDMAFYSCSHLTSTLTLPNSITYIGSNAFYDCNGLTGGLTIPNSVTSIGGNAFYNCSGLSGTLTLPNAITIINSSTFYNCSGFTGALTIPNSVTYIAGYAFFGCSGFTELTVSEGLKTIEGLAFGLCSGITTINFNAIACSSMTGTVFNGCTNLTTLHIGNNVKNIPNNAFINCRNFVGALVLPVSVVSVGNSAFENCSGFTSLTLSDSLTRIDRKAFAGCKGMTGALTIPQAVISLGTLAFDSCSGFTTINFNAINSSTTGNNAAGCVLHACTNLSTLNIGDAVLSIPDFMFYDCNKFTGHLTFPDSLHTIGASAFKNCSGYTDLTITEAIRNIGSSAFENCTGITTVQFNAKRCTIIGNNSIFGNTFRNCSQFDTLIFAENVSYIPDYAFNGCEFTFVKNFNANVANIAITDKGFNGMSLDIATLVVPPCALEDYQKAAVWENFGTIKEDSTMICNKTEIKRIENDDVLQIYPNPASSELKIKNVQLKESENVEIVDILGRIQQTKIINQQSEIILDISHLAKGIYFIKIGGWRGKFVVN